MTTVRIDQPPPPIHTTPAPKQSPNPTTAKVESQREKIPTFIPPTKIPLSKLKTLREEQLIKSITNGNLKETKNLINSYKHLEEELNTITDYFGNTLLYLAVSYGHIDTVKFLLNEGVNPNTPVSLDRTPLHRAALLERTDILECLLKGGADPTQTDFRGFTPFLLAKDLGKGKSEIFFALKQLNLGQD